MDKSADAPVCNWGDLPQAEPKPKARRGKRGKKKKVANEDIPRGEGIAWQGQDCIVCQYRMRTFADSTQVKWCNCVYWMHKSCWSQCQRKRGARCPTCRAWYHDPNLGYWEGP